MVLTWLAKWDCKLIVPLGIVILNSPVENSCYCLHYIITKHGRVMTRFVKSLKNGLLNSKTQECGSASEVHILCIN